MGFDNVKTDGLSVNRLKEETKQILTDFFGSYSFDNSNKGQYEIYIDAEKRFENQLWNEFLLYFSKLPDKWDIVDDTARATNTIYVRFDREGEYIKFANDNLKKSYSYQIVSDFRENPHYMLEKSKSFTKYRHKRTEPNDAKRLSEELNDIREVFRFNESLNSNYNFKIRVDKNTDNQDRYVSEIEYSEYNTISEILDEISNVYY